MKNELMTSVAASSAPSTIGSVPQARKGRRWLQVSLRSLLILMLVVSLPLAWASIIFRRVNRQRLSVAEINSLQGTAMQCHLLAIDDYWSDRCPDWLKDRLGDDLFQTINYVSLHGPEVTDKNLVCLKALPQIQSLTLTETNVTDAGLVEISQLPHLNSLNLSSSQITDAGLAEVSNLAQLEYLQVAKLPITDAGISYLSKLAKLEYLNLSGTQITDAGLPSLQNLTKLDTLELNKTKITDAGLIHLRGMKQLKKVELEETEVTDAGVESLKRAIPGLKVER